MNSRSCSVNPTRGLHKYSVAPEKEDDSQDAVRFSVFWGGIRTTGNYSKDYSKDYPKDYPKESFSYP